jgi:hypothetical protein
MDGIRLNNVVGDILIMKIKGDMLRIKNIQDETQTFRYHIKPDYYFKVINLILFQIFKLL